MKTKTVQVDGIGFGKYAMAYGYVDVVVTGLAARGRMNVLVFAWTGSGYPPSHHSLN